MSEAIIKVENLEKVYKIGAVEPYHSLRDSIAGLFDFKKRVSPKESFKALSGLNFEVNQGETVGIIGRNGAGKSTLLKILSQITPPTEGKIRMRGRVASLLEVGTGFHPELTGRENIFLNGAILGMTQREIRRKFDEIVAFSEIEKFLDTPVKRYSSGMYVRLAFAVAAHLEPEILIVDEVLAVGDIQFQKKCLGKMQDVAKGGRTVIFVSHNLEAVNRLCQRSIMLEHGKIIASGPSSEVIKKYLVSGFTKGKIYKQKRDPRKKMNLRKVQLNPQIRNISENINYNEEAIIRVEYEVNEAIKNALVWISLQTMDGITVLCSTDYDLSPELQNERKPGYYQTDLVVPAKWLNIDTYNVNVGLNTNSVPYEIFDRVETIRFNIVDNGTTPKSLFNESSRNGILQPFLKWETKMIKQTN
ncbi:MAG: ABC transporter ATP-binding protein [Patescibacteria group bacterium]